MNLSEQIEQDIASQLSAGKKPSKLTVAALASHYGVSQTPVRTVLSKLIEAGKIIKLPNGRLQIPSEIKFEKSKPAKRVAGTAGDPYQLILRDIVQKSLLADETFLREESTAAQHCISRSAVREFCHLIAGLGLLEHIPRRGWRIRPFSQDDMNAYQDVREVLELKALNLAWPELVDVDLQSMLDGNIPAQNSDEFPVIDNRLHGYIIDKAKNSYIADFFKRHAPFFKILFEWEGENREAAVDTVFQHREVLTAMLNRERTKAATALSYHIRFNHPVLDRIGSNK